MARNSEPEKTAARDSEAEKNSKDATVKPEPRAGKHEAPAGVQPGETEDPQQMGSEKARQRELLERNIKEGAAKGLPEEVAGQHATGSFTGRKRRAG